MRRFLGLLSSQVAGMGSCSDGGGILASLHDRMERKKIKFGGGV